MRYRSPTTIQEWFEEYEVHKPEELHASFAVFLRVYNESWRNRLKIRKVSVHSTCHQCAVWREYRKLARVPKDFEAITAAHQAHVKAVFLDRGIEERLAALGEAATAAGARVSKAVSILDMSGDGADQAKFRLPRNFTMTKLWESCWRPQLHVIGNLASGVLEAFYMTDVDLPKDANLAVTCWARSLHRCSEILQQREQEMPEHVRFHTDNAASEGEELNSVRICCISRVVRRLPECRLYPVHSGPYPQSPRPAHRCGPQCSTKTTRELFYSFHR